MFTASNSIKRNKNNKFSKKKVLNVIPMPQYATIQKENESEARDIKEHNILFDFNFKSIL